MKNNKIYYGVGPLMYTPAYNESIAQNLIKQKFGTNYSLSFCLEDTVNDNFVKQAEEQLIKSVNEIYEAKQKKDFDLPKLFIRVREPNQIIELSKALGDSIELITGFIVPKFSLEVFEWYRNALLKASEITNKKLYIMPIYESKFLIDPRKRLENLFSLKEVLSEIEELVLNIRVGGNDLSNYFGFRRHSDESIHRIKPIADVFSDIISVYGMDYVVSGPVWEYYSGDNWEEGLRKEIKDDLLCGFIGKTVIHPNQIPVVNDAYKVSKDDYEDAKTILEWDKSRINFVSGSKTSSRMNEVKTHGNWARKIMYLADQFGIKDGK